MRGAIPAGMCLALERAGLIGAFDRIYGCSSGALAGCYAAAGQAAVWAESFEDAACRAFIDPRRALRRRPVLDFDFLFDVVIRARRPLSAAGLAQGPELRAVAVAADAGELRVLAGFEDPDDALAAVRASCTIPVLAGPPLAYRGERLVDGGLIETIPYRAALRDGATHVLVLRSRAAAWRTREHRTAGERLVACAHPELAPLLRERHRRYNAAAAWLANGSPAAVTQVAAPAGARLVARFSTDAARIADAVALGAAQMTQALTGAPAPARAALPEPAARVPATKVGTAVAAP